MVVLIRLPEPEVDGYGGEEGLNSPLGEVGAYLKTKTIVGRLDGSREEIGDSPVRVSSSLSEVFEVPASPLSLEMNFDSNRRATAGGVEHVGRDRTSGHLREPFPADVNG